MGNSKKSILVCLLITTAVGLTYCKHKDQELDLYKAPVPIASTGKELLTEKVTTPPVVDGVIDAAWQTATKLVTTVQVPDPGNDYFKGYVGDTYTVTLRSVYDQNNIYFLAEWNDAAKSLNRDPWYFDPASKTWKEENRKPTFDANGVKVREAFYEDKFAMLWNIDNSMPTFNVQGCYASCHTSLDPATHGAATARHFTGSSTELLDMWHWKSVRTGMPFTIGKLDDQLQNNTEFDLADGGRHSDPKISGGYTDNVQTLPLTGGAPGETVSVPKYVIPGRTNYYWIMKSEQNNGTALPVTAVDVNGILTYGSGATMGTIDPNTDVAFQRSGGTTGSKAIPSVYDIDLLTGDRGDINAVGVYTGSGWVLEFSRPLITPSGKAGRTDVQFDVTNSYLFGIAVFNNAAIAHAIEPKITLRFK
jgi:hypothetical protein